MVRVNGLSVISNSLSRRGNAYGRASEVIRRHRTVRPKFQALNWAACRSPALILLYCNSRGAHALALSCRHFSISHRRCAVEPLLCHSCDNCALPHNMLDARHVCVFVVAEHRPSLSSEVELHIGPTTLNINSMQLGACD